MKPVSLVLLLLLSLSACKPDPVESFGQQVAARIQAENQSFRATRALVFTGNTVFDGGDFSFDGEFLLVGPSRYNLYRLVRYLLYNSAGTPTLAVYF